MSDLMEIVADAIRREIARPSYATLDTVPRKGAALDAVAGLARATVAAIEASNHRIVPVEPTLEMRKVCSFETAEVEWPAMLAAAPKVVSHD